MDMPPAIIQQCAAGQQDVLVSVKGNPEQVKLFQKDALTTYSGWKVDLSESETGQLLITLRGRSNTPYWAVVGTVANSSYRLLKSNVTFACGAS